ncbi:hypothetical protein Ccrd_018842 [Cynara cardunculus var. scolymus]|uniref:Uncharacterized protein n=1 Tax=Cynara cardunculus var. scolymus TaxID=59895 RepID=A0A118K1I4_CYNCS|nr:hypothetical protein Ccrd_018842 [Cynara cardunculus var. scolymus]
MVSVELVIEAANLASNGHPFEVVYYQEFCVKASNDIYQQAGISNVNDEKLAASVLNPSKVKYDMRMCMSIRPGRSNAGSSLSLWFVVKIMMRSSPQQDHSPSMKFRRPDKENYKSNKK